MDQSKNKIIKVDLAERSYDILLGENIFGLIPQQLKKINTNRQVAVISVPPVSKLYYEKLYREISEDFNVFQFDVPDGEQSKSSAMVEQLYEWLFENKIERNAVIIALGGGVVGDLAGFVASTYLRGINLVHVPTSLLAQVDSSIGGKVGINHKAGKNLIGAFYQPRRIYTDISVLQTLSPEEYICGLGEVVKYGVIADPELFTMLESQLEKILAKDPNMLAEIVYRCASKKAEVVSKDERESGLRAILNYGHTFAHALETVYGYGNLKHGQAVLLGMICANYTANRLKILSDSEQQRIDDLIYRLPVNLPSDQLLPQTENLLKIMYLDKKVRDGKLQLVLADKIGHVSTHQIADEKLISASFEHLFDMKLVKSDK
jgi:3-dehydroquinate synthase